MKQKLQPIVEPIVKWYQKQEKTLPWKQDKEPYHIWVSEIMLQQTRIEAVKKYYTRFMKELPTIQDLAVVPEEKLLKLWEGLGYYSRAKNLKKSAIQIQENNHGKMPTSYVELLKLFENNCIHHLFNILLKNIGDMIRRTFNVQKFIKGSVCISGCINAQQSCTGFLF